MDTTTVTQNSAIENATPFSMYIDSLRTHNSKRTQAQILNRIAEFLGDGEYDAADYAWHETTREDVGAARDWMEEEYAPSVVNKGLSALRSVLREAWRMGLIDIESYMSAIDIPNVKNHVEQVGRLIDDDEIRRLLSACHQDRLNLSGVRDHAMIALMYATGARRSEIVHLDIADLDTSINSITFRETKGRKDRTVFIKTEVASILSNWIFFLNSPGAMFTRILKGGAITQSRLTDQGLWDILAKRAKQAGVSNISPHDFRRTFISKMMDNGIDMVTIAKIVGHENVQQTMGYDRRGLAPAKSALMTLPT